jgi:hypothetical protein
MWGTRSEVCALRSFFVLFALCCVCMPSSIAPPAPSTSGNSPLATLATAAPHTTVRQSRVRSFVRANSLTSCAAPRWHLVCGGAGMATVVRSAKSAARKATTNRCDCTLHGTETMVKEWTYVRYTVYGRRTTRVQVRTRVRTYVRTYGCDITL